MPLLASEAVALKLIETAEAQAKRPYMDIVTGRSGQPARPLTAAEVMQMTRAVKLAGLQALFVHMTTVTVVAGSGGGPAPVVGKIL